MANNVSTRSRRRRFNSQASGPGAEQGLSRSTLLFIGLLLVGFFLFSYLDRLVERVQLQSDIVTWQANVARAKQRRLELQENLRYVQSDQYVEDMARSELGLVQAGDEVLVVLPDEAQAEAGRTPERTVAPDRAISFNPFDLAWWSALFQ